MRNSCGETVSYQQLAATIGKPAAVRAVASACGANKLAMVIPCHRVVRRDGALSGYRWGVRRKAQLLKREAQRGVAMLDLFADEAPGKSPGARRGGVAPLCVSRGAVAIRRYRFCRQSVSVSSDGDAGRLHHVGGDDQLRRVRVDYRSSRLLLCRARSVDR